MFPYYAFTMLSSKHHPLFSEANKSIGASCCHKD